MIANPTEGPKWGDSDSDDGKTLQDLGVTFTSDKQKEAEAGAGDDAEAEAGDDAEAEAEAGDDAEGEAEAEEDIEASQNQDALSQSK